MVGAGGFPHDATPWLDGGGAQSTAPTSQKGFTSRAASARYSEHSEHCVPVSAAYPLHTSGSSGSQLLPAKAVFGFRDALTSTGPRTGRDKSKKIQHGEL